MSLPVFSTQAELFSTAGLSASLFSPTDRYRLFARLVYPKVAAARATLASCYCAENGRVAIEPVLMLGVSILQEVDGVPDRQALEMLRYHAGWNFALNRQLGDAVFHPTSLVNFRNRLEQHKQSALAFKTILEALVEAGLVSRQSRQRLDSTQMFGRVAKMSRLDCVREAMRLALEELQACTGLEHRPVFWIKFWERYVESQVDYRLSEETLGNKLGDAGADVWQLLEWLREPAQSDKITGTQTQLLRRVFSEQFEVIAGPITVLVQEKKPTVPDDTDQPLAPTTPQTKEHAVKIEVKGKGQLDSNRVQNPNDPEATYAVKGQGQHKKEHVGYKLQVAETVCEEVLAPGEPTRNFIVGIVAHQAHESDELGAVKIEQEQESMGLEKPPVQYVDAAYVSAKKLVEVQSQGRELIGPAQPAPIKDGRFSSEDFQVNVQERSAICPAAKTSTQCSRLEEEATGRVSYRFEFSTHCHGCHLREQCLGKDQRHRTLVVGEHHSALQTRRQEQKTDAFKKRMKHRNAIEGTQSELVRSHGLRRARYRGLAKTRLQSYFAGAACNLKRWIRLEAWNIANSMESMAEAIS